MLARDEVLVRCARPEALEEPARRAAEEALLTPEERAHVARFHFERDRLLHLAARALLRRTLSACADVPPDAWRFGAEPGGRPLVRSPELPLRFSVTHTRGLAVIAVAVDADVGVDAEVIPDEVPHEVVEGSFAPGERALLAGVPRTEQPATFAAIWTLKEAYAKARGLGLALPFESFDVALDPPRLLHGDDPRAWHLQALALSGHHRAALCVHLAGVAFAGGAPPRVRLEVLG